MTYAVIHNKAGDQIGYIEGGSVFRLSGKMLYHVDKNLNLAPRGDGQVVGQVAQRACRIWLEEGRPEGAGGL